MWKYPRSNNTWELLPPPATWQGVLAVAAGTQADNSAGSDLRGKRTWPPSPRFLLLPAKSPHWPSSIGSQKAKGPGDIIHLGQPQSRPQSRRAKEAGGATGGYPAQHVSENMYLSRQEKWRKTLPEPCMKRKRGVGVFRESRRSFSDRSLCCCCWCWGVCVRVCVCMCVCAYVCVCVREREREREIKEILKKVATDYKLNAL